MISTLPLTSWSVALNQLLVVGSESVPAFATGNKSAAPAAIVKDVAVSVIVLCSVDRALLENCCGISGSYTTSAEVVKARSLGATSSKRRLGEKLLSMAAP